MQPWNWLKGGLALGGVLLAAVVLVKPLGVSTQYVIADAAVWSLFDDQVIQTRVDADSGKTVYTSSNPYLARSNGKYAKSADNLANYSFVFVLAMIGGAALSALLGGPRDGQRGGAVPDVWKARFGAATVPRNMAAFAGGLLTLYGARLAGGCTSGHMISGMSQTAVSGYLFAAGVFAAGIPLAMLMYRNNREV